MLLKESRHLENRIFLRVSLKSLGQVTTLINLSKMNTLLRLKFFKLDTVVVNMQISYLEGCKEPGVQVPWGYAL